MRTFSTLASVTRIRVAALAAVALFALAACGASEEGDVAGDGSDSATNAGDGTGASDGTDTGGTGSSDGTDGAGEASGDSSDPAAGAVGGDGAAGDTPGDGEAAGGSSDPFCAEVASQQEQLAGPDSPLLLLGDPPAYFEAVLAMWADLAAVAPPELADSLASGQEAVADAAAATGDTYNFETLLVIGTDPDFTAANEAIADYAESTCGIALDGFFSAG